MNQNIDPYQYRDEINPNEQFDNAWYVDRFIVQLLNVGSQSIVQKKL